MDYGLIGEHLKHSFSKQIHEGIAGYSYELCEVKKEDLASFMLSKKFKAINVTIPYKEAVIPYLDEISEEAKAVGAVNVVLNKNGKLIGYNTDMLGFTALIEHMCLDVNDKNILILGNGGASKAVVASLNSLGVKSIIKASIEGESDCISYEEVYNHQEIEVVVNTTPTGMYPNNGGRIIDLHRFANLIGAVDVIYNPIRTNFVNDALEMGVKAEGGLYMLVAQAVYAIELFLDKKLESNLISRTYHQILRKNSNIVLIGMPTCGKSTIGKQLAERFHLDYLDTDKMIIDEIGMPIKDYFAKYGEESFREVEKEIVRHIYQMAPKVISTGGGVIKNKINMDLLRQNGTIVYIHRDLDLLRTSSSRPLSSNKNDLEKLYEERLPIYRKYADIVVENNEDSFAIATEKLVKML